MAAPVSAARQGRAASVCRHVSGGLVQRGEVWWVQFDERRLVVLLSGDDTS
ncbi:type II toxin-antitoxin system PemK/MazF family toxin, partial [Streptomyces sp. NPDC060020]